MSNSHGSRDWFGLHGRGSGALWSWGEQVSQPVHRLPHAQVWLECGQGPQTLPVPTQPGQPQ